MGYRNVFGNKVTGTHSPAEVSTGPTGLIPDSFLRHLASGEYAQFYGSICWERARNQGSRHAAVGAGAEGWRGRGGGVIPTSQGNHSLALSVKRKIGTVSIQSLNRIKSFYSKFESN